MLAHPDLVKQVFTGDPRVFHAGEANVALRPLVGRNSVLLLDEGAHMAQRKLMLPSFHGERMQRYGELMAEVARREIQKWPLGTPMQLLPSMQELTLEVIVRAVFGVDDAQRVERLRAELRKMLDLTANRQGLLAVATLGPDRVESLGLFRRSMAAVDELVLQEVHRRRQDPALEEREDVLSLLLQAYHEDGSPMSDAELRDELITLLVAGHETTATSLAWAMERLLRHPDKLERLTEEVASGDDAYLDAVAKETLRLRPVLPIVLRRLTEPVEMGGYVLPAGVSVAPCIYLLHRRPDVYPEPRRFVPERFLEQPAGTYTWIPFGGGVRRCLGATFAMFEMKTVLSQIVQHAHLRPATPEAERVVRRAITLTPSRRTEVVVGSHNGHAAATVESSATVPSAVGAGS
jgi:cytochrome P450